MARKLQDKGTQARALSLMGGISYLAGDQEAAHQQAIIAVALARQAGDVHLLGDTLSTLAIAAPDEQQRSIRLEALDCFRRCGDDLQAAGELHMLYGLDLNAGQIDDAQAHLEEAVALAEPLGDEVFLYFFRGDLAMLRLIRQQYAEAAPLVRRCLLAARRVCLLLGASECILGAACCAAWEGEHEKAALLHGAADVAIEGAIGDRTMIWSGAEEGMRAREQAWLRDLMGARRYDAAYREGARLSPADAVDLALSREATERVVTNLR